VLTSSRATNILLVLILAVGVGIVGMLATGVRGGPLDPSDPPASTMRPLDETLASWSIKLAADDGETACNSSRFECVFGEDAVLDHETGLVWERLVQPSPDQFYIARNICHLSSTGGRAGWRLPTTAELTSLMDPGADEAPFLPAGHPFTNVSAADPYWTSTLLFDSISQDRLRELVFFDYGLGELHETGDTARYWCVRGGKSE
jgi:hypothetical protein